MSRQASWKKWPILSCTNVAKQSEQLSVLKKAQSTADAENAWYTQEHGVKNQKRTDILAERLYVIKRRSQGQRHVHEEWQNHHWKAVDAAKNCNKREFFVFCGKMDRRNFLPIPSAIPWMVSWILFVLGLPEDDPDKTYNATQEEPSAIQRPPHTEMEEPDKSGQHVDSWKFQRCIETTCNDGSSWTRLHLHPSTGKDSTTTHGFTSTFSAPRRAPTMESNVLVHQWKTDVAVIVIVIGNDMVEYATLRKSSTVARVATKWVARSKGGVRSGEYSPSESSPPFAISCICVSFFFQISPANIGEYCARDGEWT